MRRKQGNLIQFPGHYRHDLIVWRMDTTGITPKLIEAQSRMSGTAVHEDTVERAMNGECGTIKKLWVIAEILNLNFSELFNFNLRKTEFDRAVLNGSSKAVRSAGPVSVGGRRPAP